MKKVRYATKKAAKEIIEAESDLIMASLVMSGVKFVFKE